MSVTYHPDLPLISGTPWVIAGTLYDATGKVLDVTNCTLVWTLLDPNANPVLPLNADVQITKTDPVNGAIQISVAESDTALLPGRYTDALQITEGASSDVFWIGNILVAANPQNVAAGIVEQPAPAPPPTQAADYWPNQTVQWWGWQQQQGWY
jgi:hypothetical protein